MHPNTTPPAPPPAPLPNGNGNQYDFIMNTGHQPKKGIAPNMGGGSMTQRIIIVVVGGLILLTILIVMFSVIFKGNGGSAAILTDLAQQQNEIARVADIGITKATSSATKNLAHTTKLSMLSSQQDVIAVLAKKGHKVDVKSLALKQNAAVDQQLATATANNTFDETFTKLLKDELSSYQTVLLTDYKSSTSQTEKLLFQDDFNSAALLIGDKQNT